MHRALQFPVANHAKRDAAADAPTILIVEDDVSLRRNSSRLLKLRIPVAIVVTAEDGASARRQLAVRQPSVVLVDRGLPDVDGAELIRAMKQTHPDVYAILMTGGGADRALPPHLAEAINHVLLKPFEVTDLVALVERAATRPRRGQPMKSGKHRRPTPLTTKGLVRPHELYTVADAAVLPAETRHAVINRLNRLLLCARALEADAHDCDSRQALSIRQHVAMVVQTVAEMARLLMHPSAASAADEGGGGRE